MLDIWQTACNILQQIINIFLFFMLVTIHNARRRQNISLPWKIRKAHF